MCCGVCHENEGIGKIETAKGIIFEFCQECLDNRRDEVDKVIQDNEIEN